MYKRQLTRSLEVYDGAVRTDFGAFAALHTLALVYVCHLFVIKGDRSRSACILTPVCNASSAHVCDNMPGFGTFIAGYADDLDNVGIFLISPQRQPYPLRNYGSCLLYTSRCV